MLNRRADGSGAVVRSSSDAGDQRLSVQRVPPPKTGTNMITEEHIKSKIKGSTYIVMPDGRTTVCQLSLSNGFSIIGTSSCINASEFNLPIGREIAYKNAFQKVWELEGYLATNQIKPVIELPVINAMKNFIPAKNPSRYGFKVDGTPRKKPGRKPKK